MSFVSSIFGGGGGPTAAADVPARPAAEQAATQARERSSRWSRRQGRQRAEPSAAAGSKTETPGSRPTGGCRRGERRQQRLRGGGIQRFMTAGYAGYGDSRALGTGLTLGG